MPRCAKCGTSDGEIFRLEQGHICDRCLQRYRLGRDATTRVARSHRSSMMSQSQANRQRQQGAAEAAANLDLQAGQYACEADVWAMVPGAEIALGEAVPSNTLHIRDTLTAPDAAALDASARRIELLSRIGVDSVALGVDAAQSIGAQNSLEKMLAHQLAVAHTAALEAADKACFEADTVEKARLLNVAARLMATFQGGLLTLHRLRSGSTPAIIVQKVAVSQGGQAIVANVQTVEKGK